MVMTIEQALVRIAELESENKALREELERYKNICEKFLKKVQNKIRCVISGEIVAEDIQILNKTRIVKVLVGVDPDDFNF